MFRFRNLSLILTVDSFRCFPTRASHSQNHTVRDKNARKMPEVETEQTLEMTDVIKAGRGRVLKE